MYKHIDGEKKSYFVWKDTDLKVKNNRISLQIYTRTSYGMVFCTYVIRDIVLFAW